jgi:hypothetical protein
MAAGKQYSLTLDKTVLLIGLQYTLNVNVVFIGYFVKVITWKIGER